MLSAVAEEMLVANLLTTITLAAALCAGARDLHAEEQRSTAARGHYLLVWAGDRAGKGNDFLAVIDADPASAAYGRLVTTLSTDQRTEQPLRTL